MDELQVLLKKQEGRLVLCLQVLLPGPKKLLGGETQPEKEDKT